MMCDFSATARSETDSGISNQEWFQRHGELIEHRIDFDFGLHRLLDGIECYINTRPTMTRSPSPRTGHRSEG